MRRLTAQLALHISTASRTDGELLAAFLTARSEPDFAELVRRHGPLVWGVCCRALPDRADAEDAFQAVFLVLLRRANRLTAYQTIGPWLHRVAVWTARNIRRRNARRGAKRVPFTEHIAAAATDPDLPLDLDAALLALPDKYRSPVVLCHLLGYSRAEAAHRLGCPEGTLSAWLSRGLTKLRAKLGGLDPAKPLGVAVVAVPAGLSASAVRAAVASRVAVATMPPAVSQLVEGVLHMLWVKKATAASVALVAVFALGVGVGMSGRQIVPSADGQDKALTGAPPLAERDYEKKVRELQAEVAATREAYLAAKAGIKLTEEKIALYKDKGGVTPEERQRDLDTLARFQKNADDAAKKLMILKDELDKLRAAQAKPQFVQNSPATIADIDKQLDTLKAKYESTIRAFEAREKAARAELEAIKAEVDALVAKRNALAKAGDVKGKAFLEITLRGEAAKFDFVIRETDASGKVLGTATVSSPELLVRLLARTKSDPTAPKELRLVAEPPTALGAGPAFLFKACDAAGYAKVKFTGYVVGGGFTPALKPGMKGEAPGYKWYDNAERSPASLLEEHEKGMLRF